MSVEHMALVFAAGGLDGSEKLLLLAYTNYTDPHGYCWPGEERLAEDTGTSVSTVRRTKKKLIGRNLVRSIRRAETSNLARVNLPLLASMGRPRKAYDDNEVERLSFGQPAVEPPDSAADLRTVQSDLSPEQGSDLDTSHSDLYHRSECSVVQVNLTCTTGQSDLQSISDPPGEAISRPSFLAGSSAETDGGMDGDAAAVEMNPGVALLLAIGSEQPAFLLTGTTLRDQGLTVAGMLLQGWTPEQLRQIIAGRSLPKEMRRTVGAIVAARLRDALATPPPASVPYLPAQAAGDDETFVPDTWSAAQGESVPIGDECEGHDGSCGRPLAPGRDRCWVCLRESAITGV